MDELHRRVRGAVRALAFQFHPTALIQGCCNSGKTFVLRKELENFQLEYHYSKPGISGRSTSEEVKRIWDAHFQNNIIVVDFEDSLRIDIMVAASLRAVIDAGAYVIVVADQTFTTDGTLLSQVSNHTALVPVANRCRVLVNHDLIIQKWKLQNRPEPSINTDIGGV